MSREGRWKYEEEEEQEAEGRATGERAPASQLRVNHSFHFSVRSREEGGREGGREGRLEGAGGCATATGKGKLIIGLWL